MDNFRLTNFGAALRRLGTVLTSTTAVSTVTANANIGGFYWPSKRTAYVIVATGSGAAAIYSTTYNLPAATTYTFVSSTTQRRAVIFSDGTNETVYLAGAGGVAAQKFDGTTVSNLPGAAAQVNGLCVYNDRLWGWNGNNLYFSNLSSALGSIGGDSLGDTSNQGGVIKVNTFGESDIVTCAAVNGNLLIFHAKGISILTGWGRSDIQVEPQALNATIGMGTFVGSGNAICVANEIGTGDVAYFMTPLGMYATNGGWVKPLDNPQKPDPLASKIRQGAVAGELGTMVTFNRAQNEVWVGPYGFVSGATLGFYVYNVVLQSWSGPFTGTYTDFVGGNTIMVAWLFEMEDLVGSPHLWLVSQNGTHAGTWVLETDTLLGSLETPIYKDVVTPNGSTGTGGNAYQANLQLHRLFGNNDRVLSNSWRWLYIVANMATGTQATVSYSTALNGTVLTSVPFGAVGTGTEQSYRVAVGGVGPYIDVLIEDSTTTGQCQYAYATVEGNLLGWR